MRCAGIKIHAKIPVPTNSDGNNIYTVPCFRDCNDVVYQIDAIRDACDEAGSIPIIRYKDDGSSEVIGIAHSIQWNQDGFIEVDGILWFGGTSEEIIFDSVKDAISMTIESSK